MTAKQALAEAVKRWGKAGAVHDRGKAYAVTPERRAAARAEAIELAKVKLVEPDLDTWPDEAPVEEYRVALRAWRKAARENRQKRDVLLSEAYSFRFAVGSASWAFEIKGSGDTWEEAFANADKKEKK